MIATILIGIALIIGGIWMFIANLRGTRFTYLIFDIIPIPFSFWGPLLIAIAGVFMLFIH